MSADMTKTEEIARALYEHEMRPVVGLARFRPEDVPEWVGTSLHVKDIWLGRARAAVEAMRIPPHPTYSPQQLHAADLWNAGIDAILNEKPEA